jgi:hypothetical protein
MEHIPPITVTFRFATAAEAVQLTISVELARGVNAILAHGFLEFFNGIHGRLSLPLVLNSELLVMVHPYAVVLSMTAMTELRFQ